MVEGVLISDAITGIYAEVCTMEQSSMFNYLGIHFHISQFIQADTSALVNFSVSIDTFDRILLYKTD